MNIKNLIRSRDVPRDERLSFRAKREIFCLGGQPVRPRQKISRFARNDRRSCVTELFS